ncbi:MAG TPA: tetratricopeptide repeat protein [Bryobacteraceae bacterium]|nr:tetratricopeptide repeat protein [Bryobacteraceae bacterium]
MFLGAALWVHARRPGVRATDSPLLAAHASSNAYDSYLRGTFLRLRHGKPADSLAAIDALKRATEADPSFAKAYAALALAYADRLFFVTPAERKSLEEEAYVAAEKAASLNPNLAEIYIARAHLLWTPANHFAHERAVQQARRAVALDPNSEEGHNELAQIYNHIGLLDRALQEARRAAVLDPSSTPPVFQIGHALLLQGEWEQALRVYRSIPEEDLPEVVASHMAWALFQLGRSDEATALIERYLRSYPADPGGMLTGMQALLFAAAGDEQHAQDAIAKASKKGDYGHFHHTAYWIANAYARMHRTRAAMHWLQETGDTGFPCYPLFLHDPNLNSLRGDSRFIQYMGGLRKQWEYYKGHL